jgi:xanthine dehydrogenase YagR molybdenum-binding subunit
VTASGSVGAPAAPSRTTTRERPFIGQPLDRVDGPAKVTGTTRYTADVPVDDLAHAAVVHATVARGRIARIDTTAALGYPGVIAVITHVNAPRLKRNRRVNPLDLSTLAPGTSIVDVNTDEIHYDGQPVAVVVAETLEAAQAAADLVTVSYDRFDATADFAAETANATVQRGMPGGPRISGKKGDAERALEEASVSVDVTFSTPQQNHNALEPHATVAIWSGDQLTVYDGTQNIEWVRNHLAHAFDVGRSDVRVISTFVGGAFGGKTMVWPNTPLACMAARATNRPVKLVLTRNGLNRVVGARTATSQRIALGAASDGRLTSLVHTAVIRQGKVGGGIEQVTSCSSDLYDSDNVFIQLRTTKLDLTSNQVMRAPGEATGTFALESGIDELAERLDVDPIDLRIRNISRDTSTVHGAKFSHRRLHDILQIGRDRFGWDERPMRPRSLRDGDHLVGWGMALAWHPAWQFPANVSMRLGQDGTVTARCAFQEMGMGGATAQAQVIADLLAVDPAHVTVEHGDSDMPFGPGAGGSAQSASLAAVILEATTLLRRQLVALARGDRSSPLYGADADHVESRHNGLYVIGTDTGETYADLLVRAGRASVEVVTGPDRGMRRTVNNTRFMARFALDGRRWVKAASGAHFCEVRVDRDTGEVRVSRWVGVFDIGTVLNHKTAASQLRGGIVMGLGLALSESTLIDPRTGRIMNPAITEYHVPVHADVPHIDVVCLDEPDPQMPLGVLGAGEVGITGAGAAVANAVYHATGKRVRDLPITLDQLL